MSTQTKHQAIIDIIIPAYNEAQSLPLVIRDIPKNIVRFILVCDNGSTDDTATVAQQGGAKVIHQPERGYGAACLAGIGYLKSLPPSEQPDIVVFLDGDFSDFPEELPGVVAPIIENGMDMVIGSRRLGGMEAGAMTFPQRFGNWLAPTLIRLFYGQRFSDLGPFRAIRWPSLLALDMQDRNFGWTVEMQVKAAKHKLRCTEVPVRYRKRAGGKSKVSGTIRGSIAAGWKIMWVIFRRLF